ncbi:hypothetical protein FOPE_10900 [Fonsecaea pedrosoi]|nr:hypothetical protein FOPE_10900 [Fonsecaea pedrosoi]
MGIGISPKLQKLVEAVGLAAISWPKSVQANITGIESNRGENVTLVRAFATDNDVEFREEGIDNCLCLVLVAAKIDENQFLHLLSA